MTGDLGSKKKKRVGVGKAIRDRIHARDNFACQKCGRMTNLNIHHILAVQDGGKDDDDNLITLCFPCHREWGLAEMVLDVPFDAWLPLPPYDVLLLFVMAQGNMMKYGYLLTGTLYLIIEEKQP